MLLALALALLLPACSSPPPPASSAGFVARSGSQLLEGGRPFRFAGANIYWLGLDENVGGVNYPTPFRVDDALAAAKEMGATVIRSHTLGISVGCALCVEPSPGTFNQAALAHIDYAIKAAGQEGLKLIIPLVDNWHYYHGGKHTFTDWRGIRDENQFYTDPAVIGDFERYIATLLNHVNGYTHVAYKDDPTILAWETGNELAPPLSWTETIAGYLKRLDPHHLVMDGSATPSAGALALPDVDAYTAHYYALRDSALLRDAAAATGAHRVCIVGEYGWDSTGGDPLPDFLAAILRSGAAGDLFWSLFAHSDTYGYVGHDDGYTLHYPGDDASMRRAVALLRAHAYQMEQRAPPADSVPGAPLVTSIAGDAIAWRGTAVAAAYSVERSTAGPDGPWTVICDRCATDLDAPWRDRTQPAGPSWYRVRAYNRSGVPGDYSPPYRD
jgi:hypothetical protein